MKPLPYYILLSVLVYSFLMSGMVFYYRCSELTWAFILLTISIILSLISFVSMLMRSIHFAWIQLLGGLISQLFLIPQFFILFFAIAKGEEKNWSVFLTILAIEILLSVVSLKSFKIIEEKQKETSQLP